MLCSLYSSLTLTFFLPNLYSQLYCPKVISVLLTVALQRALWSSSLNPPFIWTSTYLQFNNYSPSLPLHNQLPVIGSPDSFLRYLIINPSSFPPVHARPDTSRHCVSTVSRPRQRWLIDWSVDWTAITLWSDAAFCVYTVAVTYSNEWSSLGQFYVHV